MKPREDVDPRRLLAKRTTQIELSGIRKVFELGKSLKDPINLSIGQPHFDVPEPLESRGIAAYRATWELFFRYSRGGDGSFNIVSADVTAGDRVAWCNCILGIEETRLRLTVGLRREGGRWLVAHEHHSYAAKIGEDGE